MKLILLLSIFILFTSVIIANQDAHASSTVSITSPTESSVHGSGSILVTGTASDPNGIQKVEVSVDSGPFSLATGTTSWSFTTGVLSSGSHTIVAKATSNAGFVVTTTIPVGSFPQAVAVNPTTNTVYVSSYGTSRVSVINGLTNTVSSTIPVGFNPQQIAINPSTNTMYVVSFEGSSITVVNMATNTVTTTIPLSSNGNGVAVNPTTNTVYASRYFNNDVVVINGATNTITSTISGISGPGKIAVNPTTNTVYVANGNANDYISVINGATNVVTTTIHVGSVPLIIGGSVPSIIAVNPTTNTVYVTHGSNPGAFSVINGATNTVTATMPLGIYPYGITLNPTTNIIYVSNLESNSVSVINGATNTVTATVPVGNSPREIAVNPTTNTVYTANLVSNSVSVINGAPENTALASVSFSVSDSDGDGIIDAVDNCPATSNTDQADTDGDGIGNVCDATPNGDADGDGVDNLADNCPVIANPDQTDTDGDGIGDACDPTPFPDTDDDGYTSNLDCNDNNSAINPGATEIANDGIDQDCNGSDLITTAPWTITGYYNPVDMNNIVNTIKSGQSVPLKFEVFDGSTEKTNTSDIASFTQKQISCSNLTTVLADTVEITNTGGTSLKYDITSGQFHANWKTPSGNANTCWEVKTTTTNGPSISAYFKLK